MHCCVPRGQKGTKKPPQLESRGKYAACVQSGQQHTLPGEFASLKEQDQRQLWGRICLGMKQTDKNFGHLSRLQ